MAAEKHYRKLISNPIGLGKGLTINSDEPFSSKLFTDNSHKIKIASALKLGIIEEVDVVKKTETNAGDLDDRVAALEKELELTRKQRDDAILDLAKLQGGDGNEWETMSKEQLVEAYIPTQLRKIISDNFEDIKASDIRKKSPEELAEIIITSREENKE